jgi:hypothetical protein
MAEYFELEDQLYQAADDYARSLGIDTQADPEGFDYDGLVQRLRREEWSKTKEQQPPLPFKPLPKGVRTQTLKPSPARGGLTSDPFRAKPVRVGGERTVDVEGARAIPFKGSSPAYSESQRADELFSRELLTYPWKQEAVSARLGMAGDRVLIAKPTQAEKDIVEGVQRAYADAWSGKHREIVFGPRKLETKEIAQIAQRLAARSGLTFSRTKAPQPSTLRGGYPTASVAAQATDTHTLRGLSPGERGMVASASRGLTASDAFGPYRPSSAMMAVVRQGLPEYRTRWVIAHETMHSLMGLRDKDLGSQFLRGVLGNEAWRRAYPEMLENTLESRAADIADYFERSGHPREQWLEISRQASGIFPGRQDLSYPFYVSSEQEVLAEAGARMMLDPKGAEAAMPEFTKTIKELFGRDPELKKRGIEVGGVAAFWYLAAEALGESDEAGGT